MCEIAHCCVGRNVYVSGKEARVGKRGPAEHLEGPGGDGITDSGSGRTPGRPSPMRDTR